MLELVVAIGFLSTSLAFLALAVAVREVSRSIYPPRALVEPTGEPRPEMPLDVQQLIDMESEPWAQQDLEIEAKRLYAIHEDWAIVHMHLLKQVGEISPQEAQDRAWTQPVEAVDHKNEPIAEGF